MLLGLPNTAFRKQIIWMLTMLIVFGLLMIIFRPPPPNMFALLGVLLAIGGSGWLYWEPILTEEEVAEFAHMMMNVERSYVLDNGERHSLLIIYTTLLILFGISAWAISQFWERSSAPAHLAALAAVYAALGGAAYSLMKLRRMMAVKRAIVAANLTTHEERVLFVRAEMRTWGFACLLVGGLFQIPLILVF